MHILFFAEEFPASKDAGGVRVSVRKQAEILAERHRVTVVTMQRVLPPLGRYRKLRVEKARRDAAAERIAEELPAGLTIHAYNYLHLPVLWPIAEPLQIILLGVWALLRHARDAALVHAHRAFAPGVVAAGVGMLTRRPSFTTVYGSDVHVQAVGDNKPLAWWIRWALRHVTRVIGVSRRLVEALGDIGVAPERGRYVPSGVDIERFRPVDGEARAALRERLGVAADAHVFLAINLFLPVKGHEHLVRAFERLCARRSDCMLVMTSDGPLRGAIEAQVREAGLEDRVHFTGFLDYDAIPDWIAAADVLVLPSLSEGMPLSILEGFACGRPLVGSRVGGIPELVSDERYGILVPPADPEALAGALEQAMDREWDRMALQVCAQSFSWRAVVDQLLAVYDEIVPESSS